MGLTYAKVDMQYTAKEKQHAAQDQPLGGTLHPRGPFVRVLCDARTAERDFHVILKLFCG